MRFRGLVVGALTTQAKAKAKGKGRRRGVAVGAITGLAVLAPAWSIGMAGSASATAGRAPAVKGTPVDVLFAASLTNIMDNQVGPAFKKATGYKLVPFPGESKALASQIRGKLEAADVFVSASPMVDKALEGKANGDRISGYTVFGTSALVIGYDPKTKFAAQLKRQPWYRVVGAPGFRLGRTDPATDPKGVLAATALTEAATRYHLPALAKEATDTSEVFPETGLVGRVQAGQLDAGFFYEVEAVAAGVPTVPLTGFALHATYTVAVVNGAPHPAGARAFAAYLLGAPAQAILHKDGMTSPGGSSGTT